MSTAREAGYSRRPFPGLPAGLKGPKTWFVGAVAVALLVSVGGFLWVRFVPPTVVPAVSRIAAGASHTCAVTGDGHVKCWGSNENGQLGDGTYTSSASPVDVKGLERVKAVATGSGTHTCALTEPGAVWCWGANDTGQLGNDDTASSPLPVQVTSLESGALGVAVGRSHTCAVTTRGLACWGDNTSGELGDGSNDMALTPVEVPGYSSRSAVALGTSFSCGIVERARVQCWGDDGDGQLGDQGHEAISRPLTVAGIGPRVVAVSASDTHACAVDAGGALWCWGANTSGQLGIGATSATSTAVQVPGVKDVTAVAAGYQRTCVLHKSGSPECWGGVTEGEGNKGTASPTAMPELGPDVASLSLGTFHSCLMTTSGTVKCWGSNTNGQLGNGTTADSDTLVVVPGF